LPGALRGREATLPAYRTSAATSVPGYLTPQSVRCPDCRARGVLTNPGNSSHDTILVSIQSAASSMGVTIVHVTTRSADGISGAFSKLAQEKVGAVIATADPLFNAHTHRIAESAVRLRMPTISRYLPFAEDGGMMSYEPDFSENFRRAATYVDKILKGANPGDLPIEQVTRVSLTGRQFR